LVQMAFTSSLKEVSDDVSKQLRSKEHNETAEYVLLYGRFEKIVEDLGPQVEKLLQTEQFAFGRAGDRMDRTPFIHEYHNLYNHITLSYLGSRAPVGPLVLKNLRKFAAADPKPEVDFESFARRSVQYILDICHNEQALVTKFFHGGPLLTDYPGMESWNKGLKYTERLEENILSHLATLNTVLAPYLNSGDLQRICKLVNWLETIYMTSNDEEAVVDDPRDDRRWIAQALLTKYLWPSLDALFIKAAAQIEHFKPSQEDLRFATKHIPLAGERKKSGTGHTDTEKSDIDDMDTPTVLNAYPTVRTAVKLLVMYNEGPYDRPVSLHDFTK
jgi:conserved oligomeric Golgi complex subunit 3